MTYVVRATVESSRVQPLLPRQLNHLLILRWRRRRRLIVEPVRRHRRHSAILVPLLYSAIDSHHLLLMLLLLLLLLEVIEVDVTLSVWPDLVAELASTGASEGIILPW